MINSQAKDKATGTICAAVSNIIFGFSFLFSTKALAVADVFVVLGSRFFLGFLCLNLLFVLKPFRDDFKQPCGKFLPKLLLLGLFEPVIYFICEQYGLIYTNSATTGALIAVIPVVVMVFSFLFMKEKSTPIQIAAALLSFVCVVILSVVGSARGDVKWYGIIILAGAVLAASAFNVLSRSLGQRFSAFKRTYFMFLLGFVVFVLVGTIKIGFLEYFNAVAQAFCNKDFLIGILYLSIISSVVAFLLYNVATSKVSAVISASFANASTVVSVLAGVFILKEPFTWVQALCCVGIVVGVLGVSCCRRA